MGELYSSKRGTFCEILKQNALVAQVIFFRLLSSSCLGMTFLSQLYPSSQNEGALRGEMNRQQAKNAFPGQELSRGFSL